MLSIVRILDQSMNNTSLILLFTVGKKSFLFPGDAQIENWTYALATDPKHAQTLEKLAAVDVPARRARSRPQQHRSVAREPGQDPGQRDRAAHDRGTRDVGRYARDAALEGQIGQRADNEAITPGQIVCRGFARPGAEARRLRFRQVFVP